MRRSTQRAESERLTGAAVCGMAGTQSIQFWASSACARAAHLALERLVSGRLPPRGCLTCGGVQIGSTYPSAMGSVLDPMPVSLVRQEAPRQEACGQEGVHSRALCRLLGLGPEHSGESAQRGNPAYHLDRDWPTAGPPMFFPQDSDTGDEDDQAVEVGDGRGLRVPDVVVQ